MHLFLMSVNHKTTPVDIREHLDFAALSLDAALAALAVSPSTSETVVLSTCNRAELYVACDEVTSARAELLGFLGEYHGLDTSVVFPHLYEQVDGAAARHLFRMA